jgi:hypothetical protein
VESGVSPTVAHRLVLQRALATLVADRTVQRVVDQEHLHDALLRLVGNRRGQLGLDDHAGHDRRGAGRGRLGHAPAVAHVGDLDKALAAGAGRVEQWVITEAGDLDAYFLGGADDQSALRH